MPLRFRAVVSLGWVSLVVVAAGATPAGLAISPGVVALHGASARQQLIATGTVDGRPRDLTLSAEWTSESPAVVEVEPNGVVHARGDGEALVVARVGSRRAEAKFRVEGTGEAD